DAKRLPPCQDVLVQDRDVDRLLSLDLAATELRLLPLERLAFDQKRREFDPTFKVETNETVRRKTPTITLWNLRHFLENPADAAMRYHLQAKDEWSEAGEEDFEPLVSPWLAGTKLVEQTLQNVVRRAEEAGVEAALSEWPAAFTNKYREGVLRGKLPE